MDLIDKVYILSFYVYIRAKQIDSTIRWQRRKEPEIRRGGQRIQVVRKREEVEKQVVLK